jgi:hypothetical protein
MSVFFVFIGERSQAKHEKQWYFTRKEICPGKDYWTMPPETRFFKKKNYTFNFAVSKIWQIFYTKLFSNFSKCFSAL